MKKILLGLTAIFGILPGVLTIQNGLGTPENYQLLFGGVVEAIGVLILLLLYNHRDKISGMSRTYLRKYTITSFMLFALSLIIYVSLISIINVQHESRGNLVFPIYTTGELSQMIEKSGSRIGAIERYGIDAVEELITKQPDASFIITKIVLLIVFVLTFSSLTFGFGINGFYKNDIQP